MYYKKCAGYDEDTAIKKVLAGSTGGEPIYIEKEVVINAYCSLKKTSNFNCSDCPIYKQEKIPAQVND